MKRQSWTELSSEPMSVDAIRRLYVPAEKYRISPNTYEARTCLPGILGLECVVHVLSGRCQYRSDADAAPAWSVTLEAGEVGTLPPGRYTFQVLDDMPVRLVDVFELPEKVRRKPKA